MILGEDPKHALGDLGRFWGSSGRLEETLGGWRRLWEAGGDSGSLEVTKVMIFRCKINISQMNVDFCLCF